MKQRNNSVHVHWDKRYPKKGTNLCPIQLGININGLQFKVGLKLYATREDFDKAMSGKSGSKEVKELRSQISGYVSKAEATLDKLLNPTRESFQRLFKSETDLSTPNKTDVTFLFQEYINNLHSEDRIKTAQNLEHALKSFKRYKSPLYFEDINESFLKGYKAWMNQNGNSSTTAQIYMRNLRTIFTAIKSRIDSLDGPLQKQCLTFIGSIGNIKLSDEEMPGKEKVLQMADQIIKAFEYRHFVDVIDDIEQASLSPEHLDILLTHLEKWEILESRSILEIIKGRIKVIDKFFDMIVHRSPETANRDIGADNFHDLIGGFP
ncbi:MAG: phage integrase SAM-like domain-containing protein [Bacteroidetes bacterium]|nr:phage integrase SAM-like domain-containing protein [Bacteroidota bacterium]